MILKSLFFFQKAIRVAQEVLQSFNETIKNYFHFLINRMKGLILGFIIQWKMLNYGV